MADDTTARSSRAVPKAPRNLRLVAGTVVVAAVAIAAVVTGTAVAGGRSSDGSGEPVSVLEPVLSAVTACPPAHFGAANRFRAAIVPGLPGQDSAGAASLTTLHDSAQTIDILGPGASSMLDFVDPLRDAVIGQATGGYAPGFTSDLVQNDKGVGLQSTSCMTPAADLWFLGASSDIGRQSGLVLVNPDNTSVQVDVDVFNSDGPVDSTRTHGIVIPSHSATALSMSSLAPASKVLAVHVAARAGRIAASMTDTALNGLIPMGTDWLPVAAPPGTTIYVPGVYGGAGVRTLSLFSPSGLDTTVGVKFLTATGSFKPAGLSSIDLPAGKVIEVDITSALRNQPVTIELTAGQSVVAGVRQQMPVPGAPAAAPEREQSFTASAVATTAPMATTGLLTTSNSQVLIWITAPQGPAEVTVSMLPHITDGLPARPVVIKKLSIAAGRVAQVKFPIDNTSRWATGIVTPASGSAPVVVAHLTQSAGLPKAVDGGVTGYPWTPLRVTVDVPATTPDLGVAIPAKGGSAG